MTDKPDAFIQMPPKEEYKFCIGREGHHYAAWKTDPKLFMAVNAGLSNLLLNEFEHGRKPDIVVCHGSSSIFATVPLLPLLYAHGVSVFNLRKDGEKSHGADFEGPRLERSPDQGYFNAWFIDDSIASGDTGRRVADKLSGYKVRLDTIILYMDVWSGQAPTGTRLIRRNFVYEDMQ